MSKRMSKGSVPSNSPKNEKGQEEISDMKKNIKNKTENDEDSTFHQKPESKIEDEGNFKAQKGTLEKQEEMNNIHHQDKAMEYVTKSNQSPSPNSITRQSKGNQNLESKVDQADTVKRIAELEIERKARDEKRFQFFQEKQQLIAQEELLVKSRIKEEINQVKLQHREQSEKAIDEQKRKFEERNNNIMEGNQKYKEVYSQKPLFVNYLEKYQQQLGQDLEMRKKQLQQIREISKPMNFQEIERHQKQYEEKKMLKKQENANHSREDEWIYHKPEYQSKYFEVYDNEKEAIQNKNSLAIQVLKRRNYFGNIVKQNYKPKVDSKKEQEFLELQELSFTRPRERLEKEDRVLKGNSDMKQSIESAKLTALQAQQRDKSRYQQDENSKDPDISLNSFSPVRPNSFLKKVDNQEKSQYFIQQDKVNEWASVIKMKNKSVDQSLNISQILNPAPLDAKFSTEFIETLEQRQRRLQYAKKVYIYNLGESYMESMKKQNSHHSHKNSSQSFMQEEVTKLLDSVVDNTAIKKIDAIKNLLEPFDNKIKRDTKMLDIIGIDDKGRADLADRYVSTIQAKLSLLDSVKQQPTISILKKKRKLNNHSLASIASSSRSKDEFAKLGNKQSHLTDKINSKAEIVNSNNNNNLSQNLNLQNPQLNQSSNA